MTALAAPVVTLLGAVRRSLWRTQALAAVRWALWGSAAVGLLLAALHLAGTLQVGQGPLVAALLPLAALWLGAAGWAAAQRPVDAACALWADRQLGGASAYSTLLEMAQPPQAAVDMVANAPALGPLQQWALQQVPKSLHMLAGVRAPWLQLLLQPLGVALVCWALAAVVAVLHPPATVSVAAPANIEPAGSAPARQAQPDSSTGWARAPDAQPLVGELSRALRATAPRGAAGQSPAAAAGGGDVAAGAVAAGDVAAGEVAATDASALAGFRPGTVPKNVPSNSSVMPSASPVADRAALRQITKAPPTASAASPTDGPARAATHLSNAPPEDNRRQAGDSPDQRADGGVSSVPTGLLNVQRSVLKDGPSSPEPRARLKPGLKPGLKADLDRAAAFDATLDAAARATMLAAAALPMAAPATPPTATDTARLTTTEHHYHQAWIKAQARRP